ncbi:glycogen debranching N-terminal domain-containing protein [Angustibacter peucedani]
MATAAQPFLHELVTCLHAPTTALGGRDGQVRERGAQGVLHGDVRVLSAAVLQVAGVEPEPLTAGLGASASTAAFSGVVRPLGEPGPDPTAVVERERTVGPGTLDEHVTVRSGGRATSAELVLDLAADQAGVEQVKAGRPVPGARSSAPAEGVAGWTGGGVDVDLLAPGAAVEVVDDGATSGTVRVRLSWTVQVPERGAAEVTWGLRAHDREGAVVAAPADPTWSTPHVTADDPRLAALLAQSLADLDALRMATRAHPQDVFVAAGSPWFFTLFGRDSLWAARMLLPLGTRLAEGTLRTLAAHQGTHVDDRTGEEPGKIPHELRRAASTHDEAGADGAMVLPPLYYGTVDATPLWVVLLRDAWRWGMVEDVVREMLPSLRAALRWVVELGDTDGDGFLEYADRSGRGLANQGWKDSGDAIRFADGTRAEGPVALCEVQGYAHEAAVAGAELLDALGEPGSEPLRQWACDLQTRFREAFWVGEGSDRRPALALDGDKRPVDATTTNIGHLLGTGLLDAAEEALVAERLARFDMRSGYGLRTMSSDDGGYWPLSYHCGSVWPHDTAVVVLGLVRSGHRELAGALVRDLLDAGASFEHRLPELFGGRAAADGLGPQPYPASCRPQAWSAAVAVVLLQAVLGLDVDAPAGEVSATPAPGAPVGAVRVEGLSVGGRPLAVEVDRAGQVVAVER